MMDSLLFISRLKQGFDDDNDDNVFENFKSRIYILKIIRKWNNNARLWDGTQSTK